MACRCQRDVGQIACTVVRNPTYPRLPGRLGEDDAGPSACSEDVRVFAALSLSENFIQDIFRDIGFRRPVTCTIGAVPIGAVVTVFIELCAAHSESGWCGG